MRQSKTCGEPCAVCDGCLEAHDAETVKGFASVIAQQAARVDWLEANIAQAVRLIRPACQFNDEPWLTASELIAVARMVWATLATDALAERKEPT
jgi:hypothetical protein